MKEIINAVVFMSILFGGGKIAIQIHNVVRKAALEKVARGLPPLPKLSKSSHKTISCRKNIYCRAQARSYLRSRVLNF